MKDRFKGTVDALFTGVFFSSSTLGPISEKYQKNPQKSYPNSLNSHTQNIGSVDEFRASQMGDVVIPDFETKENQIQKEFLPEIPSISLEDEESRLVSEIVTRKAPDTLMAVSLDPEKMEKLQNITNPDLSQSFERVLFLQEEAKNWGGELSIKLLTQTNKDSEIKKVSVVLEAQNDFTWNEVEYKSGGVIFYGSEGDLHWINPAEEGSKIVIAKLDDTLKEDLLKALTRCGYINENRSFEFPANGSLIPVEVDKDGNISQIITKEAAYFLTLRTFSQGANVNLRKEPNTTSQILGQINDKVVIPNPEGIPDNLDLLGAIINEDEMIEVSNEGYTWILVETPTPEDQVEYAWVAYSLFQGNIPLRKVAVGPNINSFNYFRESEEIFLGYSNEIFGTNGEYLGRPWQGEYAVTPDTKVYYSGVDRNVISGSIVVDGKSYQIKSDGYHDGVSLFKSENYSYYKDISISPDGAFVGFLGERVITGLFLRDPETNQIIEEANFGGELEVIDILMLARHKDSGKDYLIAVSIPKEKIISGGRVDVDRDTQTYVLPKLIPGTKISPWISFYLDSWEEYLGQLVDIVNNRVSLVKLTDQIAYSVKEYNNQFRSLAIGLGDASLNKDNIYYIGISHSLNIRR